MSITSQTPPRDWRDAPVLCGLAVALLGALVVAGWLLHVPAIVHLWAGMAPMQFNTAVGMVLAGAGLAGSRRFPKLEPFTGAALLALGTMTLAEYATGLDLYIDQALFRPWLAGGVNPGRMGVNTAACFVLIGIACCLSRFLPAKLPLIKLAGGIGVMSVACAALIGYLSGMESVCRWGQATRMAAHTAAGFLVMGLGLGIRGWHALRSNRRIWLAGIAGLGFGCVTLMIWAGALGNYHHEVVARSQAAAVNVASLATDSFDQTTAALVRFDARWEPECRKLIDVCERDLAAYFRDFPAIISLEWVDRGTGSVLGRRISPGFKGRDPLETWRPAKEQLPVPELIPAAAGSPRLILAVERSGTTYYMAAGIDPSVMFSKAIATLGAGWKVAVTVDSRDVLVRQGPDVQEATYHFTWWGRDWRVTASPGPVQSGESHLADWILPAGLTLTCCLMFIAFLWQTSRDRLIEITVLNSTLETSKSKLQSILDAATQVSIIAADTQGVIAVFNSGAERMLQYRADEMVGLRTPAIIHDPDECRERSAELSREFGRPIEGNDVFIELARQGRFDEREWTYRRKDGSKLDVMLVVTAVRNPQGAIEGFLGIATDITARKSLERDLRLNNEKLEEQTRRAEEANLAKSEFLANMSHEIRTPMNGVLGMMELALETELTAEQREYISTAKISADSLLTVINDILDFSKIEAGKLELDSTPFHLREFIEETMKILARRAHQKGLELLFELDNALPEVIVGDASRIRQILVNLIGNAIKFTERGEVFLKVEGTASESSPADVELRFAVHDTGIGIVPEHQERIFLAFAQADGTTSRRFGGTGLGLTISQRLVTMMNGRIWVESEVGKGSTFRFTVALQIGHAGSREANTGPQGLVGIPVLVVDDNFTNRRILADVLLGWGMRATMAESGAAALQILKSAPEEFPLILTNVHMPEMDGFELAAEIKHSRAAVTIVMLTSGNYAGDMERCRKLGVEAYLTKPVARNDLRAAILRALGRQSSSVAVKGTVQSGTPSALPATPELAQSLRVLLAEDNIVNQRVAQLILTKEGHSVVVVKNGLEVLAALEKDCFDVVLMDVQMPEMDGFRATAEIRAAERLKDARIPIVAMTAHAMIGDKERCLIAGMDDYVAKPIRKAELLGAILRAIAMCNVEPVAPTI